MHFKQINYKLLTPLRNLLLFFLQLLLGLVSLRRRLRSSLFSARLLHPLPPRICDVSLWTTSCQLFLGFPQNIFKREDRYKGSGFKRCSDSPCAATQVIFLIARRSSIYQSHPRHL